jgi:hypothetical protein
MGQAHFAAKTGQNEPVPRHFVGHSPGVRNSRLKNLMILFRFHARRVWLIAICKGSLWLNDDIRLECRLRSP